MTPQALTRLDGAVLGVRVETIDALPATEDKPARFAASYRVADVASTHVRYDGEVRPGLTAVVTVVLGDDDKGAGNLPELAAGEAVSWLVYPYPTARKNRSGWTRIVGHRFVSALAMSAMTSAPASRAA